jgi:DeoD family purine-nucleoside phosphorylase
VSHIVRSVQAAEPIHLKPAAELAPRVLLPGDPRRALLVAQALLESPRMFNHHRGLWGYTGTARDGALLTVQATGMGGPSAAIVVHELIALGARTLVRIGTCAGLVPELGLGDLLVVTRAIAADGTSAALGAGDIVSPDEGLTAALGKASGAAAGPVVSSDLFYDPRPERFTRWAEQGAVGLEMEAATVLHAAAVQGATAACLLGVTDLLTAKAERRRIDASGLEELGLRLGEVAATAVAASR